MAEPLLRVGLLSHRVTAEVTLRGPFGITADGQALDRVAAPGRWRAVATRRGVRLLDPEHRCVAEGGVVALAPSTPDAVFVAHDMTVGIRFHWQRQEDLAFQGLLRLESRGDVFDVVNEVALETYLTGVVASEMNPLAPRALLEAHAVISRSWIVAQLEARRSGTSRHGPARTFEETETTVRVVRWYDREDHEDFDVCADDHCQRYQGVDRAAVAGNAVFDAVAATRGVVLVSEGHVCDARFSKCCGGMTEVFSTAWGDLDLPYLQAVPDLAPGPVPWALPLTEEAHARAFVTGRPPAFCATQDVGLLARILPPLDHETRAFYRWEEILSQEELRAFTQRRTGVDPGPVRALRPLVRGPSGRIALLAVDGEARRVEVGRELEIRRLLSRTHLFSSAFVVEPDRQGPVPDRFRLRGAGWGHGVGLCQVGAGVMAEQGYATEAILAHYYRGARLRTDW
ncbi:MAG: SpoIID/LytB domain-containing protein [Deltaproteobacteria bacterium]|nr:SpoIID/LytB domain-containing protein [Deltaproteobacteria bacterium]